MSTKVNKKEKGKYGIYLRSIRKMIWVTEEVYREYYRPIWKFRKEEQKRGNCIVERSKDWLCDGDCLGCEFHISGRALSLDDILRSGTSDIVTYADTIVDDSELPVLDKMCHEELLDCVYDLLADLDELDQQIAMGIMQNKSERDIAEACGFKNNSSVNYRKKQLMERLRKSLADMGFETY